MTVKTILVSLPTPEAAERLMPVASALARKWDAHLIGLHTMEAIQVYPSIALQFTANDIEAFEGAQAERAEKIKAIFEDKTRAEGFVSEWRQEDAAFTPAPDRMIDHARSVDLIVMTQDEPEPARRDQHDILERTIRESGRPVLVVPYAGTFETVGKKALVGWSPTREAARAVHDAIPLLEGGGVAEILTAHHADTDADLAQQTGRELALCYDRHGIPATVLDRTDDGITIGDVLLNESFERGSDLIVTGAFGHSRLYDFVIGATTTHLMRHMTVPVLFSS